MGNTYSKILTCGFLLTMFNGITSRGLWRSYEERLEQDKKEHEQLMISTGGNFKYYTRPLTYVPRSRDILSTRSQQVGGPGGGARVSREGLGHLRTIRTGTSRSAGDAASGGVPRERTGQPQNSLCDEPQFIANIPPPPGMMPPVYINPTVAATCCKYGHTEFRNYQGQSHPIHACNPPPLAVTDFPDLPAITNNGFAQEFEITVPALRDGWTRYDSFNGQKFLTRQQWEQINGINHKYDHLPHVEPADDDIEWRRTIDFRRNYVGWNPPLIKKALFDAFKQNLDSIQTKVKVTWTNYQYKNIQGDKAQHIQSILGIGRGKKFTAPPATMYEFTAEIIAGIGGYFQMSGYKIVVVDFADRDTLYSLSSWMFTQEEILGFEHPIMEGIRNILMKKSLQNGGKCMKCYTRQSNVNGRKIGEAPGVSATCRCGQDPAGDTCSEQRVAQLYHDCDHYLDRHGSMIVSNIPQLFQIDITGGDHGLDIYEYVSWKKYLALSLIWDQEDSRFAEWKAKGGTKESYFWAHRIDLKMEDEWTPIGNDERKFEIESITPKPNGIRALPPGHITIHDIIALDGVSQVQYIRDERNKWLDVAGNRAQITTKQFRPDKNVKHAQEIDEKMQRAGNGIKYKVEQVEDMYLKLLQAFTMLKNSNERGTKFILQTGNWGAGEFGNNRLMTAYLQILAAHHVFDPGFVKIRYHDPDLPGSPTCMSKVVLDKLVAQFNAILFGQHQFDNYAPLRRQFERLANQVEVNIHTFRGIEECAAVKSRIKQEEKF